MRTLYKVFTRHIIMCFGESVYASFRMLYDACLVNYICRFEDFVSC